MPLATIRTVGTSTPEVFATHTDHLRSTRFVTGEASGLGAVNVVEQTDYDPFGKITSHNQSGDFSERHKFTSHEFDASTSYTYAKARYLDTDIGRFVSEDPKFIYNPEELLEDPQQQNSYAYARNNPVKYIDPNGESATLVGAIGGGVVGGGIGILRGGGWESIANSFFIGVTLGAAAGSVVDTGGLSFPVLGKIFTAYTVGQIGVDAVDLKIKTDNPEQFTPHEIKNAELEVIADLVIAGLGGVGGIAKVLSETQRFALDTLGITMDTLEEFWGESVYTNVNDKYQSPSRGGRNGIQTPSGYSSGTFADPININPQSFSPGSLQGQLRQLQEQVERLTQIISGLQR